MNSRYESYDGVENQALRTRDVKSISKRGHNTKSTEVHKKTKESALGLFTRRAAQVLDVSKVDIPYILTAPDKKAFRVNFLKQEATDELIQSEFDAIDINALPWFNGAYIFDADRTPDVQSHQLTQAGYTFIQNPSSYLPVIALDVEEGRRFLDMCSAPGGKSALIAALSQNNEEFSLVANEPKARRAERMRQVFGILGVESTILDHDGKHLPNIFGRQSFDRILVDAECSTDAGVNFQSSNPIKDWSMDRVRRMSMLQKQLITAAYDMLTPGGVLVYSTCTLSPEENEEVVSTLIGRRNDAVVQPLIFDDEETVRKIKKWDGAEYPKNVHNGIVRVFPAGYMESFCLTRIRKPTGNSTIDSSYNEPVDLGNVYGISTNG